MGIPGFWAPFWAHPRPPAGGPHPRPPAGPPPAAGAHPPPPVGPPLAGGGVRSHPHVGVPMRTRIGVIHVLRRLRRRVPPLLRVHPTAERGMLPAAPRGQRAPAGTRESPGSGSLPRTWPTYATGGAHDGQPGFMHGSHVPSSGRLPIAAAAGRGGANGGVRLLGYMQKTLASQRSYNVFYRAFRQAFTWPCSTH